MMGYLKLLQRLIEIGWLANSDYCNGDTDESRRAVQEWESGRDAELTTLRAELESAKAEVDRQHAQIDNMHKVQMDTLRERDALRTQLAEARGESNLDMVYSALGWQGGTIHQVVAEIKRLKKIDGGKS